MVADATTFPRHKVRQSKGQLNCTTYVSATGGEIKNEGEITITHVGDDGEQIDWTIQNAKVNCPMLCVCAISLARVVRSCFAGEAGS